jgi:hypothetical protein
VECCEEDAREGGVDSDGEVVEMTMSRSVKRVVSMVVKDGEEGSGKLEE